MRAALITRLEADATLFGLCPNIGWSERRRSDALPAIVVTMISETRDYTHGGPDGLDLSRLQFDVYAEDPDTIPAITSALRAEMELTPEASTVHGGIRFHPAWQDGRRYIAPEDIDGANTLFRESIDMSFYYEPSS